MQNKQVQGYQRRLRVLSDKLKNPDKTMADLAESHGLTKEGVRYILRSAGIDTHRWPKGEKHPLWKGGPKPRTTHSEYQKHRWATDAEYREKTLANMAEAARRKPRGKMGPQAPRPTQSEYMKRRWKTDPAYRQKTLGGLERSRQRRKVTPSSTEAPGTRGNA